MKCSQSIQLKLKHLPEQPGVYLMQDSLGNIIYVGKAKNLKNRVSQYFQRRTNRDPKVDEMIQHIADLEYRILDTELDALLEECRLIKEIQPRYNRQMKNDRKYVYLKIPDEKFPKLGIVQVKEEDGTLYYGPFNSRHRVEMAIEYLNNRFLLRKCSTPGLVQRRTGCLYRQLETCLGVCTGKVSPQEYRAQVDEVCQVIEGKNKETLQAIKGIMEKAVDDLQFEKAERYREYFLGVRYLQGRQTFLSSTRRNKNLIALEFLDEDQSAVKIFLIQGNKLLDSHCINLRHSLREDDSELRAFLQSAQEKLRPERLAQNVRPRPLTQREVDEAQIIDAYLKKDRIISFRVTQKALKGEDFIAQILDRINDRLSLE